MFPHIPGHKILGKLGAGGFGTVYQAWRYGDNCNAAVKILHEASDESKVRFLREAETLWRNTKNPHTVGLYCAHFDASPPYFVMEFCEGGSLRPWVGQNRPWLDVLSVLMQTAFGLLAIHDRGGFHRDIKPDNLLVSGFRDDGRPILKIGDFGLARDPAVSTVTTAKGIGTWAYLAPEILKGSPYTAQADVYSLGITGIELLVGRRERATVGQADCPDGLKQWLIWLTEPDPTSRPDLRTATERVGEVLKTNANKPLPEWAKLLIAAGGVAAVAGLLAWCTSEPRSMKRSSDETAHENSFG